MHAVISPALGNGVSIRAVETPLGDLGRVSLWNPLERAEAYDARVTGHPEATVFHLAAWLRVLHDTYGFQPLCFETVSGALLPMMEVTSALRGRRGVALPFTDFCAPLAGSEAEFRELWAAVLAHGRERKWKSVELRGGKDFLTEARASLTAYRHVLDLKRDEQSLFEGLEGSARRAIRKAKSAGVKTEWRADREALRMYYDLHCRTRKKHGLPPQTWGFFLNIEKHILSKGLGSLILATSSQIPIAGAMFFQSGRSALYKFGASDEKKQSLRANNLVIWEAIRWFAENGFEQLDFGRSSAGNEGLRRFKVGWGAKEEKLEYVKYSLAKDAYVTDKDRSTGAHNWLFRKMPMGALKMAGAVLYRHSA